MSGASIKTLLGRFTYGGRKGRRALRRLVRDKQIIVYGKGSFFVVAEAYAIWSFR